MTFRTLDSALHEVRSTVTSQLPTEQETPTGPDRVRAIFEVLLKGRFRKGSLSAMDAEGFVAHHQARVASRVARSDPVQLTLVGFPFKVPNPLKVGSRTVPDLAEVAALMTFERLHLDVRRVYAPGIEVVILNDGAYIADAFNVPRRETHE